MAKKQSSRVTMEEVAQAAGVSRATVSRSLRGSSLIGDEVKRKVARVAKKMGYEPRRQRRHAGRSILTVKLVLPARLSGSAQLFYHFADLVEGLKEGLKPSEVNVIYETNGPGYDPFPFKKGGDVDAVVFAFHVPGEKLLKQVRDRGVACVVLNRQVNGVRSVVSDHAGAFGLLAGHLADQGVVGHCCFVSYKGIELIEEGRLIGFKEGCQKNVVDFDQRKDVWRAENPEGISKEGLKKRLDKGVTTFVAVNDVAGLILLQQLSVLGVRVPEDVRVTGCDCAPVHEITFPRLTTVDLSVFRLAKEAGRSLQLEVVEKEVVANILVVDGKLLVGETT